MTKVNNSVNSSSGDLTITNQLSGNNLPISKYYSAVSSQSAYNEGTAFATPSLTITNSTVTVTTNSTTVSGNNTTWVTSGAVSGDIIGIGAIPSVWYTIANLTNTTITLTSPYLGTNASGQNYTIKRNKIINGINTSWLGNINVGDIFKFINSYKVKSVDTASSLTVETNITETIASSGVLYNTSQPLYLLTTSSSEVLGLGLTLPNQGTYEISAELIEDVSTITQSVCANNSTYQLYTYDYVATPRDSQRYWSSICSDLTGTKLAAVVMDEYLYTSVNSGVTWQQQFVPGDAHKGWSCIASSADGVKLVAVDQGNVGSGGENSLWTSTDSGTTWIEHIPGDTWRNGAGVSVACSYDGNILLASNVEDLWVSTDSGATWSKKIVIEQPKKWVDVSSSNDGSVVTTAVRNGRIWYKSDTGDFWGQAPSETKNWQAVSTDNYLNGLYSAAIVKNGYVYTASDYSNSWIARTSLGIKNWECLCTTGTNIIAGEYNGAIYISTNRGLTWVARTFHELYPDSGPTADVTNRKWKGVATNGSALIAIDYGGYIYAGDFGWNGWWEIQQAGQRKWCAIAVGPTTSAIAEENGYIWTSPSATGTWDWKEQIGSGARNWSKLAFSSDGSLLVGAVNNGYLYSSSDGGVSWKELTSSGIKNWSSVTTSGNGNIITAVADNDFIYRSIDRGVTWNTYVNGQIDISSQGVACSATGEKMVASSMLGEVFTSNDFGTTWKQNSNLGISGGFWSINSSSDGKNLVAGSATGDGGGYLYTSSDSGTSWAKRTEAGAGDWYNSACSADGRIIIASSYPNIPILSRDFGATWYSMESMLDIALGRSIACSADGSKIFVGGDNDYIFTAEQSYIPIINTEQLGIGISPISSAIIGKNKETVYLNWLIKNNIPNGSIKLYGKKKYSTTGDWKINSDSEFQPLMFAKFIR